MSGGVRYLIVNADDFGLSAGVNAGIRLAHECGIVTSASLMVRGRAVREALRYVQATPGLDVGLHVDLGEWRFTDGQWQPVYEVVELGNAAATAAEIRRQIELFCDLRGAPPTHIDSHQHVHQRSPAREAVMHAAEALGIPLRHASDTIRYCGDFYGQTTEGEALHEHISVEALTAIIRNMPCGVTELACHPSLGSDVDTVYRYERERELDTLCDSRVRTALATHGVVLTRFSALKPEGARSVRVHDRR